MFNLGNLFPCHSLKMREVEAHFLCVDKLSGLMHMRTKHLAQRRMQQMRRRMVARNRLADRRADLHGNDVADRKTALADLRRMEDQRAPTADFCTSNTSIFAFFEAIQPLSATCPPLSA